MAFTLPTGILRAHLLPCLCPRDLARLDSAVCDQLNRPHLLETMVGYRVHLDTYTSLKRRRDFTEALALAWLQKRGMFTRHFSIAKDALCLEYIEQFKLADVFLEIDMLKVETRGSPGAAFHKITTLIKKGSLSELLIHGGEGSVSEATIAIMLERQANIKKVSLQVCENLTDNIIELIAVHCTKLEELVIRSCPNVDLGGAAVQQLCQNCQKLKVIRVTHQFIASPSFDCLTFIGGYCKNLLELDVSCSWDAVNDQNLLPVLVGCPLLQRLDVRNTLVSKASFVEIARHCSRLTSLMLHMPDEDAVIVDGFKRLSGRLTYFAGELHPRILELSIPHWGEAMRVLDVDICSVTDTQLVTIVRSCPNLTHLRFLDQDDEITDITMLAIAEYTRGLRVLIIAGGCRVTDKGIATLAQGCPDLLMLWIGVALSIASLNALVRGCPLLTGILAESYPPVDHHLFRGNAHFNRLMIDFGSV